MTGRISALLRLLMAALWAATLFISPAAQRAEAREGQGGTGGYVLVEAGDASALNWAAAAGGKALVDYGAFQLWQVPAVESAQPGLLERPAGVRPAGGRLLLRGYTLDTTQANPEPALADNLRQAGAGGEGMWIVQFIGPALDGWLEALRTAGLEVVAYLPENAFLVWGADPQGRIAASEELAGWVLWQGAYHPAYRLSPEVRQAALDGGDASVDVTIQVYGTPGLEDTLARLVGIAEGQFAPAERVPGLNLTNLRVRLPSARLAEAAGLADVYNIESYSPRQLLDEIQGQVVAGNISSVAGKTVASGPGYLAWLDGKGFPQDPAAYPLVDVIDDGIDTGDANNIAHPDFYRLGVRPGTDRVTYITNCTADATGNGAGGHGNLNAGILAGYNNLSGFPYENGAGFQYGLGISPYGPVAGTKIFSNTGGVDLSRCGGSDTTFIQNSYQMGARLTSDSWGATAYGVYNADAQLYDALTRDATSAAGNQEMLHVFAAGNDGSGTGTINSPAVAKNVLAVGAAENPRDPGVSCNGWLDADSADDIAFYSSRGPAADGRAKPDLVAPGTHVQGPATQDPAYNANYVCAPYYPAGQTLYTWSTGTSHSTPAVAGAAQLAYEYYGRVLAPGQKPSPAMLKALLINSPRYLVGTAAGGTLPGTAQGWGMLDLGQLFDGTERTIYDQSIVLSSPGDSFSLDGSIANPGLPLRVSLVWSDAPGSIISAQALVNDLDLEVTAGGVIYKGNVFAGAVSAAGGLADALNNVENVYLPAGISGGINVRVTAHSLNGDGVPGNADLTDQDFALVITNGTGELAPSLSITGLEWYPVIANLNRYPEPGETLDLEIRLANGAGAAPALGVTSHLVLTAGQASLLQADSDYANLLATASGINLARFRVAIDPAQPCGGRLGLELHVSYLGGEAVLALPEIRTAMGATSQTSFSYLGAPVTIPDFNPSGAQVSVEVTGSSELQGLRVGVDITHTYVGDLTLSLIAPWGETLVLANREGGSGDNYSAVVFDDFAARSIASSLPPFTGSYRPEQPLSSLLGHAPAGTWTLQVADNYTSDIGKINAFTVTTQASGCTVAQYFFPMVDSFIVLEPAN